MIARYTPLADNGLSCILIFIGLKMLIADFVHIPIGASLGVIGGVLTVSVVMSIARNRRMSRPTTQR